MDSLGLAIFGSSLNGARCVQVASGRGNSGDAQITLNAPVSGWDVALCTVCTSMFEPDTVYMATTPSSGTIYLNSTYVIVNTSTTITYKLNSTGSIASSIIFYAAFFKYN